jgi:phosphoglycerate kinase
MQMRLLTNIKDYDLKNAHVLVRVDYNVPVKDGKIEDDTRIKASLETINFLREKGAKVVIMSHLGRPDGKPNKEFSLLGVADYLEGLINHTVSFASDIYATVTDNLVGDMDNGDVLLLENLRFYPGEEENDQDFAKRLASFGNIYVNDAFSVSHRAHASVEAVPRILDSYAGFELNKEVEALSKVTQNPKKPLIAIIGGKKVSDKVKVLENFLKIADVILVGGGSANIFLQAQGFEIGDSFFEGGYEDFVNDLLYDAEQKGVEIFIPDDVFVTKKVKDNASLTLKDIDDVGDSDIIVDIGPETVKKFEEPIKFAGTIVWNGPLGFFEIGADAGNNAVAKAVAQSGAYSVIGGGETISSIHKDLKDKFSFVSTAGGATLDFLAGERMPGIEAIS